MAALADRTKRIARLLLMVVTAATVIGLCIAIGTTLWGPVAFWEWTGIVARDKAGHWIAKRGLWDLLQLLIVPLVLAILGIWFSRRERATERVIAANRLQEEALQGYLDRLSDLLLEKGLRESEWNQETGLDSEVQTLARARTLTLLRQLDGDRKAMVIHFLYDTGLITPRKNGGRVIALNGADLRGAKLRGAFLHRANLQGAHLQSADLAGAQLANANLMADFSGAVLIIADLGETLMGGAILEGSDLRTADLRGADTRGMSCKNANLTETIVTDRQLQVAASLEGATMPDGRQFRGWDGESYEGKETRRLREAGKLHRWGDSLPGFIVEHSEVFPGWDEPITE